jgi:hypothetical protein
MKLVIWTFYFRKSIDNNKLSLNPTRIAGTLHGGLRKLMIIFRRILHLIKNVSDKNCRENQNTHFIFNNISFFFRKSCRMWDNMEKYGRAGETTDDIQVLHGACAFASWLIDIYSEYVIFIVSPRRQCLRERVSLLRSHPHCLSFLFLLSAIRKEIGRTIYLWFYIPDVCGRL